MFGSWELVDRPVVPTAMQLERESPRQGIDFPRLEADSDVKNFLRDLTFKNGATLMRLVIWYRGSFL